MTDIKELIDYMDYQLFMDTNFESLRDDILTRARAYLDPDEIPQIIKAYEFAKKAHEGQLRLS